MGSKHEQNRAEKRERLLRAAVEAFTEAGFENTTVSDVVHRAGMTPSTFYNYYRDKDALRDELIEGAAARMVRALAEIRGEATDADDYFARVCRGFFAATVEDPANALLLRRNLKLLRSLVDHRALAPVYAALRSDAVAAVAGGASDAGRADYAAAVMRASAVEISVSLLSAAQPDVEGAVEFLTQVLAAAYRLR